MTSSGSQVTMLLGGAMLMLRSANAAAPETPEVIAAGESTGQTTGCLISTTDGAATGLPLGLNLIDLMMAVLAIVVLVVFVRRRWLRLRGAPWRPLTFDPAISLAMVLVMIALAAMGAFVAQRMFGIQIRDESGAVRELTLDEQARVSLGAYLFQTIVLLAFFLRLIDAWKPAVDRRMPLAASGLLGMGVVLAVWPLLQTVGKIGEIVTRRLTGEMPDVIAHDTLRAIMAGSGPWLIVMSALVVVVAPVMEEVAYRGLLQDALGRFGVGRWWAIIATSAAFAFMHWSNSEPHAVVTLFVLSLAFGWAYEKTGRLTTPIVMHMLFNLGNLSLALLAR